MGKTYHMLNDAYLMKHQQGVDVVIGLVETHGRKETEDQHPRPGDRSAAR